MGKKNGSLTKGPSSWMDGWGEDTFPATFKRISFQERVPGVNTCDHQWHKMPCDTEKNISSFLYLLHPISTINRDVTPSKTESSRTRISPTVSAGLLGDLVFTVTALSAPQKRSGSLYNTWIFTLIILSFLFISFLKGWGGFAKTR